VGIEESRIFLRKELHEFLHYLMRNDYLTEKIDGTKEEQLIEDYIKIYNKMT
jgi:hypothetical protein